MPTTDKDRSPSPDKAPAPTKSYLSRIMWFVGGIILGLVCGVILGMYLSSNDARQAQLTDDASELARIVRVVAAMENIVVSLAVDTERSAIGIAALNERVGGLERRVSTLEKRPTDKRSNRRPIDPANAAVPTLCGSDVVPFGDGDLLPPTPRARRDDGR